MPLSCDAIDCTRLPAEPHVPVVQVNTWDLSSPEALSAPRPACALEGMAGSRVKSFAASGDGSLAVVVLFDSRSEAFHPSHLRCGTTMISLAAPVRRILRNCPTVGGRS